MDEGGRIFTTSHLVHDSFGTRVDEADVRGEYAVARL